MIDPAWWQQLTPQWKAAFSEAFFRHTNEPTCEELARLYTAPALRFAGPRAPFPNLSFELTDLSGVEQLVNVEVLVVIYHQCESVEELKKLVKLKALFLLGNQIKSLHGIENLEALEQLYVQFNKIDSIRQVEKLTNLKELFVHDNCLMSLEGLTEHHSDKLQKLFCKPNDALKQKELMRVEQELYIRCRSL